jgi:HK97 family phage major capsid protein/HK97 family phage prohead protease
MPAIDPHHTDTVETAWDAAENVRRVLTDQPPSYFAKIFAWRDPEGDERLKGTYKFPHHEVSADGTPGAANVRGCIAAIAVLNGARGGADIPDRDRRGVWEHLAGHMQDAGWDPTELKALEPAVASGGRELKHLDVATAIDGAVEGVIRGVASVYDKRDLNGDIIVNGGFSDSVRQRPEVPLLWEHDTKSVIGKARISESETGLELEATLDTADEMALKLLRKIRDGYVRGLSIGYTVEDAEWAELDGKPVRKLNKVSVWEVSVVALPAMPDAQIVEARSAALATEARGTEGEGIKVEQIEQLRGELREEVGAVKRFVSDAIAEIKRSATPPEPPRPVSIGRLVAEDENVRRLAASPIQGGARVHAGRFEFKAVTRPAAGTTYVPTQFTGEVVGRLTAVRRLREAIPVARMESAAIQFLRQSGRTLASPVAENTAKPESSFSYQTVTVVAVPLAHYVKVPKPFLNDIAALEERIQNELLEGLADIEDYEILNGDGSANHLEGIYHAASDAAMTYLPSSPNGIDRIGAIMAELEAIGYRPDVVIIHPADWRQLTLLRSTAGGYLLGGPVEAGELVLWGCQVVPTCAMTPGTVLVGQARGTVALYDREESAVQISNVDTDDFTKNRVTVLAEERVALAIFQPAAWLRGLLS